MLDLRIIADGHPCTPLELPLKIGRAAALAEIGDQIEALIATLDRLTGDPDLEDDDPAGDALDLGEEASDDGHGLLSARPIYGVDQSKGPTNSDSEYVAYLDRLRGD